MSDSDDNIKGPNRKIGLNNNLKSSSTSVSNQDKTRSFEAKAENQFGKMEDYKNQIWDLSLKFKSLIESKVLSENKGPIAVNLEKEVVDKLIILATNMNEDDVEDYAIGSNALCMLLMKCMLIQRDSINQLHYKIDSMEKSKKV